MTEARNLVSGAIKKASEELGVDTNPKIALGYTYKNLTVESLGGVSGETFGDDRIDLSFNTSPENWRANLKRTAAHEYAHTHFFDIHPREVTDPLWKVILGEAQATALAEKCFPEVNPSITTAVSHEELGENWKEVKDRMENGMGWQNEIFFSDFYGNNLPMYYGYSLAFQIGQELSEAHDLEEFPELEKQDIIEAGNQIFG